MVNEVWGPTALTRWVNRLVRYFRLPYHDYSNYREVRERRLSELESERIRKILFELVPVPRCRRCNSPNLEADPAGYYCDAEDATGAPLMCLDHEGKPAGYTWKSLGSPHIRK